MCASANCVLQCKYVLVPGEGNNLLVVASWLAVAGSKAGYMQFHSDHHYQGLCLICMIRQETEMILSLHVIECISNVHLWKMWCCMKLLAQNCDASTRS